MSIKITATEIVRLSIPIKPFVIATGVMDYAQNTLIRIFTNCGLVGLGECSAFPIIVGETQETCFVMAQAFAKLWLGKNPLEIGERMQELHGFTAGNSTIKSAFDMALYDLSAKAAGLPLYRFLGGYKRPIETDITIGIASAQEMSICAQKLVTQGATILKLKLGTKVTEDIDRVQKVREATGPGIKLRIDANQGWSFDQAKTILKNIEPFGIEFCEQPMRTWYDDRLPELRKTVSVPIMADESCYHRYDAQRLIKNGACDSINIKLSKSGGILEAMEIYRIATAHDIPCMIGGMLESRIALSAKLHFAYACPEISWYDLDTCLLGHLEDPCIGGANFDSFSISIDDTPGIGADVSPLFLAKCDKLVIK